MIWKACDGKQHIGPVAGTLFRLVESQEQVATLSFVDTLEEQALLEDLLDKTKPVSTSDSDDLHYLLKTPFRYPPLPWGSRFGRSHERGIFYAGTSLGPTLAESAYYRLVFWYSMQGTPPAKSIRSEHTLFSADYQSDCGVRLHSGYFKTFSDDLTHPAIYAATQQLGSDMRDAGVEAFEYHSARDPQKGLCIGLFSPHSFVHNKPRDMNQWLCELSANEVSFKQVGGQEVYRFELHAFLHQGELPMPSS